MAIFQPGLESEMKICPHQIGIWNDIKAVSEPNCSTKNSILLTVTEGLKNGIRFCVLPQTSIHQSISPILFSTIINQNFVFSCNNNRVFIYRVHFSMCAHFSNRLCFASTGKVHLPIVTLLANKSQFLCTMRPTSSDAFYSCNFLSHWASASASINLLNN